MNHFFIASDSQEQFINLNCTDNSLTIRSITGKISNQNGEAINNATIKAVASNFEPIVHTISKDDGSFTLIIPKDTNVKLIVSKKGYRTVSTGIINCEIQNFMLFCDEKSTCIVKGKLLFAINKPADNIRIRITSADFNDTCFSGSDGTFVFTKVPSGKYILTMDGNECKKKSSCITVDNRDFCQLPDIYMEHENIGGTLHGIVTDSSGKPVPNAIVILYNKNTKAIVGHTKSNVDGVYFFGNLLMGTYYVEAYC